MTTASDVLENAERKLIGAGRNLQWFEARFRCKISAEIFPSDAALALLAYFGNINVAALQPEKFDEDQDSENARNFAIAADGSRLSLAQADKVWSKVMGTAAYRGIIPMRVWADAIGELGEAGPLL